MTGAGAVRALAPAKVNLHLAVHGRREDGYHELTTVMAALELADRLTVRLTTTGRIALALDGPQASADVPADARNLAWRAARAVLDRGIEAGAVPAGVGLELRLEKRIPSRAGLGGGSSDAAADAVAAREALGLAPDPPGLRRLLAGLGADCVFFHDVGTSGVARCQGVGERVKPLPGGPPSWTVLVITPDATASTAAVYAAWDSLPVALEPFDDSLLRGDAGDVRPHLATDLEAAALRAVPELAAWRQLLDEAGGAHLRLSGSGASFFGLYPTEVEAREDRDRFRRRARARGLGVRFDALTRIRTGGASIERGD